MADHSPSLIEALSQYLATLKVKNQRDGRQELNRFVQWCGRERSVDQLTPPEVGGYAESAGMWGADSAKKLKPVKAFLTYLKEEDMTEVSLAPHLRPSRPSKSTGRVYFKAAVEQAQLTPEGHANLQSRLELLKVERTNIISDIQRAMADKDFKENSPLDAAKERQGFIESSVRDLERILSNAIVSSPLKFGRVTKVKVGAKVTLKDVNSGKEIRYTLVDSREADPGTGRISGVSPVGKALLNKETGDEVVISIPRGTLHYVVKKVEG